MDTYELLWKLWCEKVPKRSVAKELLKVGKPMDVYFAKDKLYTSKEQLVFMSKKTYDMIVNNEAGYGFDYDDYDNFFRDLISGCLGFKSLSKYEEFTYPIKEGLEVIDFFKDLGINLIELDKIDPYDIDEDEEDDF